ncbi:unnamed protein product [Absidia cylindrospora]
MTKTWWDNCKSLLNECRKTLPLADFNGSFRYPRSKSNTRAVDWIDLVPSADAKAFISLIRFIQHTQKKEIYSQRSHTSQKPSDFSARSMERSIGIYKKAIRSNKDSGMNVMVEMAALSHIEDEQDVDVGNCRICHPLYFIIKTNLSNIVNIKLRSGTKLTHSIPICQIHQ